MLKRLCKAILIYLCVIVGLFVPVFLVVGGVVWYETGSLADGAFAGALFGSILPFMATVIATGLCLPVGGGSDFSLGIGGF